MLAAVTRALLACLAPMLPHLAEDAWQALPAGHSGGHASVFQAGWARPNPEWQGLGSEEVAAAEAVRAIRDHVNAVSRR